MTRERAEKELTFLRLDDHAHVIWTDGSEDEFPLTLPTIKELLPFESLLAYLKSVVEVWFPECGTNEIRKLRLRG